MKRFQKISKHSMIECKCIHIKFKSKIKKSAGREIRTPVPLRERALWLNNFQARALPG